MLVPVAGAGRRSHLSPLKGDRWEDTTVIFLLIIEDDIPLVVGDLDGLTHLPGEGGPGMVFLDKEEINSN